MKRLFACRAVIGVCVRACVSIDDGLLEMEINRRNLQPAVSCDTPIFIGFSLNQIVRSGGMRT